jgi:hypothetical protein
MADTHGPIVPKFKVFMNELAKTLDDLLNGKKRPKENGFVLLIFPFGGEKGNRVNYISNARREYMIVAMKEWLARAEGRAHDTDTVQ